jgi:hypothetical protein
MYVFVLSGIVGGGVQLGPFGTAAINRLITPAPGGYDDGRNWWNYWQGKPKYFGEKTCPSASLSTTNPTCCPDTNPGSRDGKPAINRLSYGTAFMYVITGASPLMPILPLDIVHGGSSFCKIQYIIYKRPA